MRLFTALLIKSIVFVVLWIFLPRVIVFEYHLAIGNPFAFALTLFFFAVLVLAFWSDVSRVKYATRIHYAQRADLLRYKAAEEERNEIS